MAAARTAATAFSKLSEPFDPKLIKKNVQKYHYVPIDVMYNRFDEVLGADWNLEVISQSLEVVPPTMLTYGRNEKTGFLGQVTVRVTATIGGKTTSRDGTGADYADDPDKVIKTALANAFKKAANGFGAGRYLWSEEERAAIDQQLKDMSDVKGLKKRVVALYQEQTDSELTGTAAEKLQTLAAYFGVEATDLASAGTLLAILDLAAETEAAAESEQEG